MANNGASQLNDGSGRYLSARLVRLGIRLIPTANDMIR